MSIQVFSNSLPTVHHVQIFIHVMCPLQANPEAPVELFVSYGTDPKAMGYPI
jgi:hypothetical protein